MKMGKPMLGVKSGRISKKKKKSKTKESKEVESVGLQSPKGNEENCTSLHQTPQEQARWFSSIFYEVYGSMLSSLELSDVPDDAMVELPPGDDHSVEKLGEQVQNMVTSGLRSNNPKNVEPGSPVVLVISSSATRCAQLLKGLASLTKKCKPGKLFAKHMKVEEQLSGLKERVNICVGTPNRIKKLIDVGALGLSRLELLLLDIHKNVKGLTLFTVPDVKKEFWELYRLHFHEAVHERKLKMCLYL